MTTCNARGCDTPAWVPTPPFSAKGHTFALCVPHWNADKEHPIVIEAVRDDGVTVLTGWPSA